MPDMHLKPEKYLTAEDVGCLVGRGERLVQQMYRAVIALCYDCIVISICNDCTPLPLCRCNLTSTVARPGQCAIQSNQPPVETGELRIFQPR